jgi:hypothetical protein
VKELHSIVEVIHEEGRQGETSKIVMGEWKSVDGEKSHRYSVRVLGLERRNLRCQMLTDFSERMNLTLKRDLDGII